MKAVVIGASGHCGSYLVPNLVDMGYEVHTFSRGVRVPYTADMPQWKQVHTHVLDRRAAGAEDALGQAVAALAPDVICDLISYTMTDIENLMRPVLATGKRVHVVQVGTVWVYGVKIFVPVSEDHPRNSTGTYGIQKAQIEQYLHDLSAEGKIKSSVVLPGHISGRGWVPVNPQGNVNLQVYKDIKAGREILLPDDGLPTLHHVHSADIAALICACLQQPDKSNGETFNAVTEKAMTLAGFAGELYRHYGHTPKLRFAWRDAFRDEIGDNEDWRVTLSHLEYASHCSMEKAKRVLGFTPRYNTIETVLDCLDWQEQQGLL